MDEYDDIASFLGRAAARSASRRQRDAMELYIETLTGTAFELRVSPFETVLSVKAKIQRLEGIPISQQHLIWQSMELEDDYCLHDYSIQDGATLKLVLAMRGGPINTRRVPMDDPTLREMAEYMESNRDDILDKLPGNRQVTLLVYREGDQLNFFRVVDRGDGTLTPLSESLSGASVYNLYDDDDDEGSGGNDNVEENTKLKEKMKLLRKKMETLTVARKPKKKLPHPPSGRPKSRSRRHHVISSAGKSKQNNGPYSLVPKNYPLPPVNQSSVYALPSSVLTPENSLPRIKGSDNIVRPKTEKENVLISSQQREHTGGEDVKSADSRSSKLSQSSSISPGLPQSPGMPMLSAPGLGPPPPSLLTRPRTSSKKTQEDLEAILKRQIHSPLTPTIKQAHNNNNLSPSNNKNIHKDSSISKETVAMHRPVTSSRKREAPLQTVKESQPLVQPGTSTAPGGLKPFRNDRSSPRQRGKMSPSLLDSSLGGRRSASTRHKYDRQQGLLLESLTSQEARGLLRQASLERLGSSKIQSYVRSASKSRSGYTVNGERVYTPDGTRVSSRLRRSARRDGCLSPRLPPVKHKKKNVKRCYICAKKTGLATSYQCRCGHNFCASHRYAETHGCTFDYKSEGRKLLEQSNPVISAPKLPKI